LFCYLTRTLAGASTRSIPRPLISWTRTTVGTASDPASFPPAYHLLDYSNLSQYDSFLPTGHGPVFEFLYSTRDAYGSFGNGTDKWPADAPLNATFWHRVTEEMEQRSVPSHFLFLSCLISNWVTSLNCLFLQFRPELVQTFTEYEGRLSVKVPPCTTAECVAAKVKAKLTPYNCHFPF
jgi:hypothetical protein